VQREFPNRLVPNGATRDLAQLCQAAEAGKRAVSEELYDVTSAVAQGDEVSVEVLWSAKLNVPFGKLAAGDIMRASCGMFLTWRDGKIVSQRSYDCFDPF
jgi:ketosteroid isomerase-like protein